MLGGENMKEIFKLVVWFTVTTLLLSFILWGAEYFIPLYCETVQDVQEIECTEKIEYKGKNIIYKAVHYQCCKCNEVFDSAEMMDKNILSAKNAYELNYAKESGRVYK